MAENNKTVTLTYDELQNLMKGAISAAVAEATKLNPIEQKQIDGEIEKERRRTIRSLIEAQAEHEQRWNRQNNCSHCKDKQSGDMVQRGTGQWCTGGQAHGNGSITLICSRCNTTWRWKATPQELDDAHNRGLLGYPPPPVSRCLNKDEFVDHPPAPLDMEQIIAKATAMVHRKSA